MSNTSLYRYVLLFRIIAGLYGFSFHSLRSLITGVPGEKPPDLPVQNLASHIEIAGRVAQSVGNLTRKSDVLGPIPGLQHTFVSPSADSRGAVVSYWRKYMHEVLVNRLGGLSLPRKSVVRLPDRPDMTLWT